MKTPAGFECPHFYGDYRRGRTREECRLLQAAGPNQQWTPDLCRTCPVPGIVRANACPHLELQAVVEKRFLGLYKRVRVSSFCKLSQQVVAEPYIGCGQCHPLPPVFTRESNDPDTAP